MNITDIKKRLQKSKLLKDSFWAVFGNGLGNCLLLIAGIIIARILGKDLYGEYGMVKTTMFHIASFSTLGLGFTSTKYIADSVSNAPDKLRHIIRTSLGTTFAFSMLLCILLFVFSGALANYIEEPQSAPAFRALGLIVVLRAINTISAGILAGYKSFKAVGINSVISGLVLLLFASILTYKFGLTGSFIALALSQVVNALLNFLVVVQHYNSSEVSSIDCSVSKEMLLFTIPVAIQEFSYMLSTWGGTMILTKYASLGEVGLWSAASQWNAIILFVPHLLLNVVLSHLSGLSKDKTGHSRMLKKMLVINFVCSFLPFIVVYFMAGFISTFYGSTFVGLKDVIRVITFSSVLACLSNVFHSSLLSEGRNWLLLVFRVIRDFLMLSALWIVLKDGVEHPSLAYSWIFVIVYAIYFIVMAISEISYKNRADSITI
ncbi:MAG: oligosaccharide flippase family protein [Bacteroidota bacterium]|nr:oligosaccharide flippase family protein [Bacteroidota bacterium]